MSSPLLPSGTDRRGGWATLLVLLLLAALAFVALRVGIGPMVRAGFAFVTGTAPGAAEAGGDDAAAADDEAAAEAAKSAEKKTKGKKSRAESRAAGEMAQPDSATPGFPELPAASVVLAAEPPTRVVSWRIPYPGEVVEMMMSTSLPPQSIPPKLQNPDEVVELVRRHYPSGAAQDRMGGTVILSLRVDATGMVRDPRIVEGLYSEELNAAALEVARRMKFSPARQLGRTVESDLNFTLVFIP